MSTYSLDLIWLDPKRVLRSWPLLEQEVVSDQEQNCESNPRAELVARLNMILEMLPAKDQKLIHSLRSGETQSSYAARNRLSDPAVSQKKKRLIERLRRLAASQSE